MSADPTAVHHRLDGEIRGDNPTTHTPLHVAARKNLSAMARLLVTHGADLAACDALETLTGTGDRVNLDHAAA